MPRAVAVTRRAADIRRRRHLLSRSRCLAFGPRGLSAGSLAGTIIAPHLAGPALAVPVDPPNSPLLLRRQTVGSVFFYLVPGRERRRNQEGKRRALSSLTGRSLVAPLCGGFAPSASGRCRSDPTSGRTNESGATRSLCARAISDGRGLWRNEAVVERGCGELEMRVAIQRLQFFGSVSVPTFLPTQPSR